MTTLQRRFLLLAVSLALAGCGKQPASTGAAASSATGGTQAAAPAAKPSFKSVDITGADYGQKLSLPDQDGKTRTLEDFKGKVTVIFFGYTQCPDVCPTTMAELAQIKKAMGADGQRVQGVFVSVDPARDKPELLKAYVQGFDPSFVALRGTAEQTAATAKDFRVYFAKVPGRSADSYTMDHTAGSYVYDTQGRLRLFVRHGTGTEALAADLKTLLTAG